MKLDLIAIEKLSPAGLYPLADLRMMISLLVRVIRAGIGSVRDKRSYAYTLVQHKRQLRDLSAHNQHLKIKAWVKQCPERVAWVRSVIGEATIRIWVARLRAAYVSPRKMRNDWEGKPGVKTKLKHRPRPRKAFALVRVSEIEKLLPFRPRWPRNVRRVVSDETGNVRRAARLTGCENSGKPHKPRPQPVRFFPSEIGVKIREPEPKGQTGTRKYGEEPPAKMPGKPPGLKEFGTSANSPTTQAAKKPP